MFVCVCVCMQPDSKCLTSPDRYEYGQINFPLPLQPQSGKYHHGEQAASPYSCRAWGCCLFVCHSLSPRCWSQHCGRAMDLKRLYALDYFFAITGWAKAINPLHTFHLKPKIQNKLICPKLRRPHFISPVQWEEAGNSSSNAPLLPSLFQLVAAILNVNRFWMYGLITYANEWKAIIKLSTEINRFNRGESRDLAHITCWAKQRATHTPERATVLPY